MKELLEFRCVQGAREKLLSIPYSRSGYPGLHQRWPVRDAQLYGLEVDFAVIPDQWFRKLAPGPSTMREL